MKAETKEILTNPNQRKRLSDWLTVLFSILFLLLILTPYVFTMNDNKKVSVSGYGSLVFYQDSGDIIHYAVILMLFSIIFSAILLLVSLVGLFTKDQYRKPVFRIETVVYSLKAVSDIVVCVLFGYTKSNIKLDWGGYFAPFISVVFLGAFIAVYFNFKDNKKLFFNKKGETAISDK